jgi:hypothetical protein
MAVPDIRVGDADREAATRLLRDHCAEGRLDFGELDARVDAVYSATTRRDIDAVVDDLPRLAQPRPAAHPGLWWPGVAVFHVERSLQSPPPTAYEDILRVVVPRMAMAGFDLHADVPPRRLDFRTSGAWRVGVLLHPATDGGTVVAAFGRAPRKVRKAFASLQD